MYWQVIQFGYPQFLAILRNGKPFVIRKNGLHEQWYSVTHLRYDIAKLLFTDIDDRDYNYLQCDVELYELIVITEFKFKCRKVWFDGRLCWTMPSNAKEFPKYLAFHLRYNQMYLMFSKLRMERLDLENPQVDAGVIERPVSLKRRIQKGKRIVREAKRVCKRKSKMAKTVIEPGIGEVDGGSTSLRKPEETEPPRIEPIEQQSENCSISQEMTLESYNLPNIVIRIDVLGKSDWNILRLFRENWHNIILCNGYNMTANGDNRNYKLNIEFLSESFLGDISGDQLLKSIDLYKKDKIIVLGTETKFTVYKLEDGKWTKKEYEIPPITLYYRVTLRKFEQLSGDQYTIHLSTVGGIQLVFRINEGVECVMVKFGFETLVNLSIVRKNFVKTLVYSVADGSVLIDTSVLTKFTKVNNEWNGITQKPWYLRHYAADMGGFIPIYIPSLKKSNSVNNTYTLDYQNEPNSWERIDLIKYYEEIIWRRDSGQPSPKRIVCYSHGCTRLTLFFEGKFTVYHTEGAEFTTEHYEMPPITLLTQDAMGNTTPLSPDDYTVQLFLQGCVGFIYTLRTETCTLVKFGEKVIWSCRTKENPLYVVYSQTTGRIEVIFEDKIAFTKLKLRNSILKNGNSIVKNFNSIVKTIEIPPEITLHKTNQQGETVKLNPLEYRVQTFETTGFRYVVNDDIICTELRHNNRVVWKYTEGDQKPLSFTYFFKTKKIITVKFHSKPSLKYQLQQDQ
ncbi:hypothetical protein TpMuguga_04g00246 [Theileria parva strain Muguga]|uniref:Uncharacterized protein n=1 Tax=Theileria parva TaxID=5875 RepID=Q4N124_THEPA|nr:uncharacterized protein TpMuguga_04g00246 [Theileria parva strain Muguga]EAN31598.1 hypothetical protein TpMuguga_04g00246 [Theileria parva strain Muguga]|eukprot:XP_763881.1 hypothetical protein [Theileria parva strain Muguga]